ncbi:MAG: DDE-type integrase/transposase/recombinase [Rhodobacterales bacterium]|nr:DDE-type integrase/transposase/recombinase [Rhodobacterales bacterium]
MPGRKYWRWHLDEVYVKINGVTHSLWRAAPHEAEVPDGATSDSRASSPSAAGHAPSVRIAGGDGNDTIRRRRGMIPGWPGHPRAGGKRHVQCGSGRPLPVAAKR